tara:strand:+ start:990 stop:1166 length:177 start_codon:yes stop_codon:yes gene_type:complete
MYVCGVFRMSVISNKEITEMCLAAAADAIKFGRQEGKQEGIKEQKRKPCVACGYQERL